MAQGWNDSARDLAKKAFSRAGQPTAITLTVTNLSSLSSGETREVKTSLDREFRALSVKLVPPERALAEVTVTLSENPEGLLWVAEISHSGVREIEMVTASRRSVVPMVTPSPTSVTLRKRSVLTQSTPILDFVLFNSDRSLLVLDTDGVTLYNMKEGEWKQQQSAPLLPSPRFSRDPRGRLESTKDNEMTAYLPGVVCAIHMQHGLDAFCRESDDSWPVTSGAKPVRAFLAAGKNFFTGVVTSNTDKGWPAFYSAAALGDSGATLVASTDGRLRVIPPAPAAGFAQNGWGSDVADVRNPCSNGWLGLVTARGDWTQADSVQALEASGRDLLPASPALDLSGPITSFWGHADNAASAVVRDLKTGDYEALTLIPVCSR